MLNMLYSAFLLLSAAAVISGQASTDYRLDDQYSVRNSGRQKCQKEYKKLEKCRSELLRRQGQQSEWQPVGNRQLERRQEESLQPEAQRHKQNLPVYVASSELTETEQRNEEQTTPSFPMESLPLGHITEYDSKAVTFISSNRTASTVKVTDWTRRGQFTHVVQLSPAFNPLNHSFLLGSKHTDKGIQPSQGFVHTVLNAYKDHHNLVITPDDVWTAIMVQLSRHVNANAEELRHRFVSHEGTKTLKFGMDSLGGSYRGGQSLSEWEWTRAMNHISSELRAATNPNLSHFVENNFTTTTERTRIVSGLTFMSTMQQYFKYEINIYCGIPRITLLGTQDDWVQIAGRVRYLREFGNIPAKWAGILTPIINQFVKAKREQIDVEFWGDIVRIQKNSVCGGGQTEDILDGWLSAFAVFDGKGVWRGEKVEGWEWPRINMKHVSSGVVTVPIKLTTRGYVENEITQDATVFAGHMGHEISIDGKTLTPYSGWGIVTPNTSRPPLRNQFDVSDSGPYSPWDIVTSTAPFPPVVTPARPPLSNRKKSFGSFVG